jgi:two-component system sensor histidine kinase YesM
MFKKFVKKINNLSIRSKLFISYLVLVALPFCIFMTVNIYVTTKEREQETLYSLQQVLNQTKSFLDYKVGSIKTILNFLSLNDVVQDLVKKDADYYLNNVGFWTDDNMQFTKVVFNSTYNNPDVSEIRLYMKSGMAAVTETEDYIQLKSIESEEWFKQFAASNKRLEWFPGSSFGNSGKPDYIYAIRKIPSDQDIYGFTGIIRIDIPLSSIKQTVEQSLLTQYTSAFLINSKKEIICSFGDTALFENTGFSEMIANLNDASKAEVWKTTKLGQGNFLMASQTINDTDWNLILVIPYKEFLKSSYRARRQMLLIFLLVAPLTLPLSYMAAASATNRIQRLISHMEKAQKGDFNIEILPSNEDEIGQLTRSFNHMLTRIAILIDEQFKLGHEIKNMELKALQAQINPHFLYNTLDLINWMAKKYNNSEICPVIEALSDFYKLSLSKGEDIITIEDELNHVRAYVFIQNKRFSNKIKLVTNVPDEILKCSCLKLILQPLVENSILHGIREKDDESGTIEIGAAVQNGDIIIHIKDDGVGIDENEIPNIISGHDKKDYHGYGVKNINERLKLNYGKEYGLMYESRVDIGTTVYIRIPRLEKTTNT